MASPTRGGGGTDGSGEARIREALIGGVGKDLVQEILATEGPRSGIPSVQEVRRVGRCTD